MDREALHPESAFIRLCLREPETVSPAALRSAAAAVRDWHRLVEIAGEHRVAAFLHAAVTREGIALPSSAMDSLRSITALTRAQGMLLDATLRQLASQLARQQIAVIVLKGPALARTVYPNPSLRPYNDLDLLVRPVDEAAVATSVLANGFAEVPDEAEEAASARLGYLPDLACYQRRFATAGGYLHLDLHLDPFQLGLEPVDGVARWQRSMPVPGLRGVRMLGAEDQVVQLSLHAQKHGYSRLIWLKDLDLLLRAERDRLDWPLVEAIARREGLVASVWYTLHLLTCLLGTPVPPSMRRSLRPSPLLRLLYQRIWPVERVMSMRGQMHRRAVQFRPADAWRGSLPSLVLMGRRRDRARAALRAGLYRLSAARRCGSARDWTGAIQTVQQIITGLSE